MEKIQIQVHTTLAARSLSKMTKIHPEVYRTLSTNDVKKTKCLHVVELKLDPYLL